MEYKLTFKEYSEALKENRLLGLKCRQCGAVTSPPKMVCGNCAGSDMEITELAGEGKIQTFTSNNVAAEGREDEAPYVVLLVELAEGPWVMGNLVGIDPAAVGMELIGQKVSMDGNKVFPGDRYSDGESTRPLFRLQG